MQNPEETQTEDDSSKSTNFAPTELIPVEINSISACDINELVVEDVNIG